MTEQYEYKFELYGEGFLSLKTYTVGYRDVIAAHAREGWRLVQIFAPGLGSHGTPTHFELIFERRVS